ncbi:hypothetical protein K443DRAFT_290391 [Laccaria amethystina LaAM-08-1]|uniref:Unplaced genomic scaffold K443scaffold_19, whole genome shotgun sequence n=1 Tax=Laccaria amethystina LaAM-08-1 TaxID=1095629 RepID=A0A0C9X2D9_9AGAR|nr:hypothetical protein K443DRAFT_290391 [Laccaria amethystina LaAM-08-1]
MATIRRKLVVVGDWVGKTALLIVFSKGTFIEISPMTVFDNYVADIEVDGKHVELGLWDTGADFERYRPLSYPDSHVILMCFSISNPDSLDNLQESYISEVNHFCPGLPIILVGLKKDLRRDPKTIDELRKTSQRPVTVEEGLEVAKKIGARHYVECSSKTGEGIREVFQIATREALRPRPKPPPKRFNKLIKGLLKSSSKNEEDVDSESAPQIDASEEQELKRLLVAAVAVAPPPLEKFRLLIIGKTGCGKTTILYKVCGGNMVDAPSTTRGTHDIEKEIEFEGNNRIIAHDSEGFEAGKQAEVDVVWKFIDSRSRAKDINQKLHLVWYCMEMNSRPIQQAEKDFFSMPLTVPIVAIVTKFDTFLQDMQQKLEEKAEEEDEEVDDDELEKLAVVEADKRFEQHYKKPLESMQHPPRAVVTLSEVHKSAPDDSRLARLIDESLKVLSLTETQRQARSGYDLRTFFASAQSADSKVKLITSASNGLNWNYYKNHTEKMFRGGPFIKTWETYWTDPTSGPQAPIKLIRLLEKHLDDSRRLIGHRKSSDFAEVNGDPDLLAFCRWEQRVADTTLIMEKIYVFNINDEKTLEAMIKWYDQGSNTATYIRREVMGLYRERRSERFQVPKEWSEEVAQPLINIVGKRPVEVPG